MPLVLKKPCGKQKSDIHWVHINETSKTTAHTYMQDIDIQLLKITGSEFLHSFDIFLIFFFYQLPVNTEHLYLECDIRAHTKGSSKSRQKNKFPTEIFMLSNIYGIYSSFNEHKKRFQTLFPNPIIFYFHSMHNIIKK